MITFRVIDTHTGGEPTRIIVSGGPALEFAPLAERREQMRRQFDHFRTAICNEPRGSEVMVGGLLCSEFDPDADCGVIFFNNVGYLGMCGHGTIGLVETLRYLNRAHAGWMRLQTPVGDVLAKLLEDGRVAVQNVPAFRHRRAVSVDVPGVGRVVGDIAWGGNWFFLVADHAQTLAIERVSRLTAYSQAIMDALDAQQIRGADGARIDHIELFGPPGDPLLADSRSFVLCPGGAFDRSPCGTGTSAKLACLAADAKLAPGQRWRQESIVGSVFEAHYEQLEHGRIAPTIIGRAHVTADVTVVIDPEDPFRFGIPVAPAQMKELERE